MSGKKEMKLSIGFPVYNAEKYLRKKLTDILSQTFSDFELILSDNGSTDDTQNICEEFASKDNRILYFRHEKNKDMWWNYNFVLEQAKCKYFVWTAADDNISPTFLEKNLLALENNDQLVGSMSKIKTHNSLENSIDVSFEQFKKKFREKIKKTGIYPITGNYENRIRNYLKKSSCFVIYGVYNTDALKSSFVNEKFNGTDWCINLNLLKFGGINTVNEILFDMEEGGNTSSGIINLSRKMNNGFWETVFPWLPFTRWCGKNLGTKMIIKNLDYFLQLNIEGFLALMLDAGRIFYHKTSRN